MSMAVIGFIVIVIFLLAILFYLLSMNKTTEAKNKRNFTKSNSYLSVIDINTIEFPKNIEKMNLTSLSKASKFIFDSYKALAYAEKLPSALDKIEWHTWQVSILLRYLKTKGKFFVPINNKIFHDVIIELDENQIEQDLQRIYKKYVENVNINKNRDNLSRDIIWSARDVSIIFFKIVEIK